ncbi:hypothetical protein LCGC14_1823190 [marine sediment metagenome]|uniref:Uncharacterized protein n=1 Tax=marine sediment metagenome TaxID=412755 RepID=A0A0F9H6G5_9ZZZZ
MARSISAELQTAQDSSPRKPYIKAVFVDAASGENTYDMVQSTPSTNRLVYLRHDEFPYDSSAFIILRNNDLTIPNLKGHYVEIGYGDNTTAHGGSGNESSPTARLWVEDQQFISRPGVLACRITLEGMTRRLMRKIILTVDGETASDGISGIIPPDWNYKWTGKTYYQILEYIIETEMGWTLLPLGDQDDGIINTTIDEVEINREAFEYAGVVVARIMNLTKCYLRYKAGLEVEVRFPQDDDAVDEEFYSNQHHYFYDYNEKDAVLVPNFIIVYGNEDVEADDPWANVITRSASDVRTNEQKVVELIHAGGLRTGAEIQNLADAILQRYQAQTTSGLLLTPHDARMELFDRALIVDSRGS